MIENPGPEICKEVQNEKCKFLILKNHPFLDFFWNFREITRAKKEHLNFQYNINLKEVNIKKLVVECCFWM